MKYARNLGTRSRRDWIKQISMRACQSANADVLNTPNEALVIEMKRI